MILDLGSSVQSTVKMVVIHPLQPLTVWGKLVTMSCGSISLIINVEPVKINKALFFFLFVIFVNI